MISKKNLIEVTLPLDAISAASAREALPYSGLVVARSKVGRLAVEKVQKTPV